MMKADISSLVSSTTAAGLCCLCCCLPPEGGGGTVMFSMNMSMSRRCLAAARLGLSSSVTRSGRVRLLRLVSSPSLLRVSASLLVARLLLTGP